MKRAGLALIAILAMPTAAMAQDAASPVISKSSEYRFQLGIHVAEAALARVLPAGWVSNAPTQGPGKDANIRLVFVDAGNIVGPDNRLLGKGRDLMVYLTVPVKQANGPGAGQMILAGLSENQAGSVFGAIAQASSAKAVRSQATINGATEVTEDWDFAGANGEHASLHIQYASLPVNRAGGPVAFYDPADPKRVQIFRSEQTTDVPRNVTTKPADRVREFRYSAGGGRLAALFDGSQTVMTWDSQTYYNRMVESEERSAPR